MSRPKGIPNKSQVCKYGHEISIYGRNSWGQCAYCYAEAHPLPSPGFQKGTVPWNKNKQFCVNGHDKKVTGRTKVT